MITFLYLSAALSGKAAEPSDDRSAIAAEQLSLLPVQTRFVEAEYPHTAFEQGIEAEVILLLDIDPEGKVTEVGIAEPATVTGMGFEEAAMVAAGQFEFRPAELDGEKIAVQITYRYLFVIKKKVEIEPNVDQSADQSAPEKPKKPVVANLRGVLLERGTRLPLSGVVITAFSDDGPLPVGFEAVSEAGGEFRFYDLTVGSWKIIVEMPGYYPFRTTEEIPEGEAIEVVYHVEKASYNPFDVMVTAERPKKEVNRTVLPSEVIEKIPGVAGNPLAVIQNFPGVARSNFGEVIIRGSAPEDSKILIEGTEVPLIYHFGGIRSVLPIGMLDSIEFYPGNFAPWYGRATGGIVDVKTKRLEPKKVGGSIDVSLLDTGVLFTGPIGEKAAVAIGGRRSYIDFLIEALVPDDAGVTLTTAPRYYDGQLLFRYRPVPAHEFQALLFGSDDRLKILFANPAELDVALSGNELGASFSFYRSILSHRYVPSENFENTLKLSQGRNWIKMNAAQLTFDLDVYLAQVRDTAWNRISPDLSISYGLDFLFSKANTLVNMPRPPKEGEPQGRLDITTLFLAKEKNDYGYSPAIFTEFDYEPIDGLVLLPGVRVEYFDRVKTTVVEPRFTVRKNLSEQLDIKAGVSHVTQEPSYDETDTAFGNPDLGVERAMQYSLGAEYKPLSFLNLDLTGFYKQLWDLVSGTDRVMEDNGEIKPLVYDNKGSGRVYGLETVLRHDITNNLSGWVAYTLSRAERHDSGQSGYRLFDFDQTHILTGVITRVLPHNWQIGARFRLISGNPFTPVIGGIYNADSDQYDRINGAVNSDRLAPYHQLDIRLDKRWVYRDWMLNLYMDIQNVYSGTTFNERDYNYDFSEKRSDGGGLPILTILGVQAEF